MPELSAPVPPAMIGESPTIDQIGPGRHHEHHA